MSNSFGRILKMAEIFYLNGDMQSLKKVCNYFGPFMKKYAHVKDDVPEFFKSNFDYSTEEESPYMGSVKEFLKKFPGGIMDYLEFRKKESDWAVIYDMCLRIRRFRFL